MTETARDRFATVGVWAATAWVVLMVAGVTHPAAWLPVLAAMAAFSVACFWPRRRA